MTTTAVADEVLTIDEFVRRHGGETNVELVRGIVVRYPMPGGKHGEVARKGAKFVGNFVDDHALGRVMSNDTFIVVRFDDPPVIRGADACYLSYNTWPKDRPLPDGPLEVPPELVIEVRSPSDRWGVLFAKVGDYLTAGVRAVVVFDPRTESASVYRQDEFQQIFHNGDEFTLPDILPGFAVPVRQFFE
jgi:Uma2 family endonuclease